MNGGCTLNRGVGGWGVVHLIFYSYGEGGGCCIFNLAFLGGGGGLHLILLSYWGGGGGGAFNLTVFRGGGVHLILHSYGGCTV